MILDIETNGLLEDVSKFHCAVTLDYDKGIYKEYRPDEFDGFIKDIKEEVSKDGTLVMHNGISYDVPVMKKLAKSLLGEALSIHLRNILDTLVLSRLIFSNLKDTDIGLLRVGRIKGKHYGSHSLEAWGYRFGQLKGDFVANRKAQEGYTEGTEWDAFSEDMLVYNKQDVHITKLLLDRLLSDTYYFPNSSKPIRAVTLEHEVAHLLAKMVRNGYPVDKEALTALGNQLSNRQAELSEELISSFGSWYSPHAGTELFRHPRTGKPLPKYPRVRYLKNGSVYTPIKHQTFNPSSRLHIIKVLKDAGWTPTVFTEKGSPKVDEEILQDVKLLDGKVNLIREYLLIQKRLGQIQDGDRAWLKYIAKDGKIHGSINPNGAVTGRCTHSHPNMAQVPSIQAPYGHECRSAFGASHHDPAWIQVGSDASGLELRCLAHYMAKYDQGEYAREILEGDIHTKNQMAAGLPTRDNAKTFIYGFLYGAGPEKIGSIVGGSAEEGKTLIRSFLTKIPAIQKLRQDIKKALIESTKWNGHDHQQDIKWKRNYIKGLDGRKIYVRSPHAALNTILQGAGALICKQWIVHTDNLIRAQGYTHGWHGDYCLMAYIHDETQWACRTQEVADVVQKASQEAMKLTERDFLFKCHLDTESKTGATWADCH